MFDFAGPRRDTARQEKSWYMREKKRLRETHTRGTRRAPLPLPLSRLCLSRNVEYLSHSPQDAVLHEAVRHSQFGSDPIRVSLRPPWSIDLGRESCP